MSSQNFIRWKWPTPSVSALKKHFDAIEDDFVTEKAARLQFVLKELGPPSSELLMGGYPSFFARHEMCAAYIDGHFLSTLLTAQVYIETSVGTSFVFSGEDEIAEGGLGTIIHNLEKKGVINPHIASRLRDLHKMRIAYGHLHVGTKQRGYMARLLSSGKLANELLSDDAKEAIRIVADFMRFTNPEWHPDKPEWQEALIEAYGEQDLSQNDEETLCLL